MPRFNKDLVSLLVIFALCLVFAKNFLPLDKEILAGVTLPDAADLLFAHSFSADLLKNFTLPFWNPYVLCGVPALAEPHNAIFYPLNLIFILLPTNIAFNYSIVIHLMLAGFFMYFLARTLKLGSFAGLCAASSFIFSSIFSLHIFAGHLNNILTIPWLPLIFLFTEKYFKTKKLYFILFAGIALCIQIFSGHLQYVAYTIVAISFYLLFRFIVVPNERLITLKAGLYLITSGLLLAAIQLIPTLEFVRHSTRTARDFAFFSSLSFPPENLITIIIPEFFGNSFNGVYTYWGRWFFWEMCIYIGVFPLVSAIIALRLFKKNNYVRFFSLLSILSLIIASGYYIPFLKNILSFIPVLSMFRAQAKLIFLTVFSLSILSGFGVDYLFKNRTKIKLEKKQIFYTYILIFVFAAIIFTIKLRFDFWSGAWFKLLAFLLSFQERYWFHNYWQPGFVISTFLTAYNGIIKFIVFLAASLTIIVLLANKNVKSGLLKCLIVVFIIFDLWSFSAKYLEVFHLPDILLSKRAIELLKEDNIPSRIATKDIIPNISSYYKLQNFCGNSAIFLQDYSNFIACAQNSYDYGNYVLYANHTGLLHLIGFKYLLTTQGDDYDKDQLKLIFSEDRVEIFENPHALPRAFMVFEAKIFTDKKHAMDKLKSKDFDPRKCIILETSDKNKLSAVIKDSNYKVQITKYAPNEVILFVDTASDGYLFLSDVYYPAWKVFVDGKLDKIYKANIAFRAVYLKQGRHIVRFAYDSLTFKIGMAISLITLLFLAILISILLVRYKSK